MRAIHLSRDARHRHDLEDAADERGGFGVGDVVAARRAAQRINLDRAAGRSPGPPTITAGELIAVGVLHEVFHRLVERYETAILPGAVRQAVDGTEAEVGRGRVDRTVKGLAREFGRATLPPGHVTLPLPGGGADATLTPAASGAASAEALAVAAEAEEARREALVEGLLLAVINDDPAADRLRDLFDDRGLRKEGAYSRVVTALETQLEAAWAAAGESPGGSAGGRGRSRTARPEPFRRPLPELLRAPSAASPTSLAGQLRWIREHWAELLAGVDGLEDRLLLAADLVAEEERALHQRFGGGGPAPAETPDFTGLEAEPERFSDDTDWMPRVVLQAKSTYVWLDQLSRRHGREIRTLDAIPDEELDTLARWGVTGLWLIGLWQRSRASERIKHLRGNPDAVASAYSLDDYRIADDLGGEAAYETLRERAAARGIRLASDMVPNHMGLDSAWVIEHPDRFLAVPESPFPAYAFSGPDLSSDPSVEILLEDHYWESTDAAVVFRRRDTRTGDTRFIYHGNDGTSFPWNDTAQLDYLRAEVREAVIRTILDVARRFPIIRFDAAMVLAKRHVRRLWWPEPGAGGGIPSRAEHALSRAAFETAMPHEFWREVVDRVAAEVPGTLLLAEAFWLMEGFFVRTLGMHRVYNSAFMHMLRDEDGAGYRKVIRDTIEFDPAILGRYVNFMSNPDEKTAIEQFGDGDKYFGVATVLATLPGLPMLGHGQVEGLGERYGMEFRRPTLDEQPNAGLVARHERELFPLLRQRRRFAGSAGFRLYDFVTDGGAVDEHVLAYTNGTGAERSLVLYHDRFASTAGRIRDTAAFAVKGEDGEKRLERTSLADALGLSGEAGAVVSFRDPRTGFGLATTIGEIRERGLGLRLEAYENRAFTEIEEHPAGDPDWSRLAARLGGAGAASLLDALAALRFEGIHVPLLAAIAALPDLDTAQARLAAAAIAAGLDPADAAAGVARAVERLAMLGRDDAAGSTATATAPPVPPVPADPIEATARLGWAALAWLPGSATARRAAIDEWRLTWPLGGGFAARGLDDSSARAAATRTRFLAGLPIAGESGPRRGGTDARAAALLDAWLADPELRAAIGHHAWEGTAYVAAEGWGALVATTAELAAIADPAAAGVRAAQAVERRLTSVARDAGYRVEAIRSALATGSRPSPGVRRSDQRPPKRRGR
ncbi:MAG: alpha-amylase [Chloroflexota bacterium]|nr:MAG: alpha-amylase [Chloroflexota bacterium]